MHTPPTHKHTHAHIRAHTHTHTHIHTLTYTHSFDCLYFSYSFTRLPKQRQATTYLAKTSNFPLFGHSSFTKIYRRGSVSQVGTIADVFQTDVALSLNETVFSGSTNRWSKCLFMTCAKQFRSFYRGTFDLSPLLFYTERCPLVSTVFNNNLGAFH